MPKLHDKLREQAQHLRLDDEQPTWQLLVLPGAILWLELLFKLSTTGASWPALGFVVANSVVFGLVLDLLTSLLPWPVANRTLRAALLFVLGFAFGVEYFVHCEFKMFYDLATVTSGAGHATSGFSDQIEMLVFTPSGIAHVVAFMAPFVVYLTLMRRDPGTQLGRRWLLGLATAAVVVQVTAEVALAGSGTFGLALSQRYNFQTVVQNFGLLTGVRREVENSLMGSRGTSFSTDDTRSASTGETVTETSDPEAASSEKSEAATKEAPKKAEPAVLDIDFAKLAETTDGTWASLDRYVAAQTPSAKNSMTGRFEGYNLVFVSAEAFCAEAIDKDVTPTLWRMANKGIQFTDYYQPASAGTTGGEYQNIFGMLPTDGGASVKDTADHNNSITMGWALNRLGYEGWMFHNNDYTYYDRHITHNMLGYNHGFMGYGNGMEQWVADQWPQSDLEMVKGTWENLYGELGDAEHPFNVYYMSVSGHGIYTLDSNAMSRKWWDEVADLPYSDPVKAYIASNIDLDRAMEYLIDQLEERDIADRTLIVIAADHFPYGLDGDGYLGQLTYLSELYGYDVQNLMQRDHNRLIMWCGDLEGDKPIVVDSPTSSLDILPTLLNLFGVEWDSRLLPGRDVFSDRPALVFNTNYDWKTELGTYYDSYDAFEPAEGVTVPEGYVDDINTQVMDKINYCEAVLDTDYYRHVFGEPEDVDAVNAAGKKELANAEEEDLMWGEDIVRRFVARQGTQKSEASSKSGASGSKG